MCSLCLPLLPRFFASLRMTVLILGGQYNLILWLTYSCVSPGTYMGSRFFGAVGSRLRLEAVPTSGNLSRIVGGFTHVRIVILMVLLIAACSGSASIREYPTTLRCPDCQTLAVSKIIDGDTLDTPKGRVRLFGVDSPERGERCYGAATSALKQLAGRRIRVELGPRAFDSGGRILLYVFTEAGNSIDEMLVQQGLARAWTKDGQYRDHLFGLEREAKRKRAGCLW